MSSIRLPKKKGRFTIEKKPRQSTSRDVNMIDVNDEELNKILHELEEEEKKLREQETFFDGLLKNHHCEPHNQSNVITGANRIVCIGDIHGDFEALKFILYQMKLTNENGGWIGGNTHLVLVGDITDGQRPEWIDSEWYQDDWLKQPANEGDMLYFLAKLEYQSQDSGGDGRVWVLLGNHELGLYLDAKLSYVRHIEKDNMARRSKIRAGKNLTQKPIKSLFHINSRRNDFHPGERYAKIMGCMRRAILQIDDFLFVHAGVFPGLMAHLNTRVRDQHQKLWYINWVFRQFMFENVKVDPQLLDDEINPLITRFYSDVKVNPGTCNQMADALESIKEYKQDKQIAQSPYAMIIGHTVQYNGITSECDNRLWRIDVGISGAFGRRHLQCLDIRRMSQHTWNMGVVDIPQDGSASKIISSTTLVVPKRDLSV